MLRLPVSHLSRPGGLRRQSCDVGQRGEPSTCRFSNPKHWKCQLMIARGLCANCLKVLTGFHLGNSITYGWRMSEWIETRGRQDSMRKEGWPRFPENSGCCLHISLMRIRATVNAIHRSIASAGNDGS